MALELCGKRLGVKAGRKLGPVLAFSRSPSSRQKAGRALRLYGWVVGLCVTLPLVNLPKQNSSLATLTWKLSRVRSQVYVRSGPELMRFCLAFSFTPSREERISRKNSYVPKGCFCFPEKVGFLRFFHCQYHSGYWQAVAPWRRLEMGIPCIIF